MHQYKNHSNQNHGDSTASILKGAFTYDVSSRGGRGFEILTVADKGGRGLSLADVSKNTSILAKIVLNQACLSLCVIDNLDVEPLLIQRFLSKVVN